MTQQEPSNSETKLHTDELDHLEDDFEDSDQSEDVYSEESDNSNKDYKTEQDKLDSNEFTEEYEKSEETDGESESSNATIFFIKIFDRNNER